MTTTYTRSCYGNRETVTSLSKFWSCQVVVTWPSSKVINKQISFILFILHLTETLVPLWDTLVVLFNRDTHSLCLTKTLVPLFDRHTRPFIWQRHSSFYLTETLVTLFDRDTSPFIWQRHSSLYFIKALVPLFETLAQRHSSLYLTQTDKEQNLLRLKRK